MIDYKQPLRIGQLSLQHRLIQGPLAGYSCAPMRAQFAQYCQPAYAVTEMLSAQDVIHKHQAHGRYLFRSCEEGLVAYQLSGNHPQILAMAAKKCASLGADLIDLNCGCPMPKIIKKGCGSALLSEEQRLSEIIIAIKQEIQLPLSIKIRITPRIAQIVEIITQAGADAIVIHARGPKDDYSQPCDYLSCRGLKQLTPLPIIINGDIFDQASLEFALSQSQADAAMIARAGCGQPWFYQSLLNGAPHRINPSEQADLLMRHLTQLATLDGEYQALLQARGLLRYYFRQHRHLLDYSKLEPIQTLQTFQTYLVQLLASIATELENMLS